MADQGIQVVLAFFGSIFPAVLFNIDRRKIWLAGLCGAIGWIVYLIIYNQIENAVGASFLGAFVVGIYSEAMARKLKTPAFEFLIPGIFPLVPGFMAYTTLRYIVENQMSDALYKGIQTLGVGGAIAFGMMLSIAIFKFITRWRSQKRKDQKKKKPKGSL